MAGAAIGCVGCRACGMREMCEAIRARCNGTITTAGAARGRAHRAVWNGEDSIHCEFRFDRDCARFRLENERFATHSSQLSCELTVLPRSALSTSVDQIIINHHSRYSSLPLDSGRDSRPLDSITSPPPPQSGLPRASPRAVPPAA